MSFTFTINGTPTSVTSSAVNPFTGLAPSSGSWIYYLINKSSSIDNITITNNSLIKLHYCLIGCGGSGGTTGTSIISYGVIYNGGTGGGGGAGEVIQYGSDINSVACSLTSIVNTPYSFIQEPGKAPYNAINGGNGTDGGNAIDGTDTPSTSGNGGNGGNGGGAGGYGGSAGTTNIPPNITITLVPAVGTDGNDGNSNNGATNGYTPVTFADGQSANLAYAGKQGEGGNIASLLVYYQIS